MLAREVQGAFTVTTFITSEPQKDRPVDVSVMVQERDSNNAILDATVKLVFTPPAGSFAQTNEQECSASGIPGANPHFERFAVVATRRQASNKLLYAAPLKFDASGIWQLHTFIKRGGDAVKVACSFSVSAPPQKWIGLLPYLLLPPLMVVLFAANQWLRRQSSHSLEKLQPAKTMNFGASEKLN